MIHLKATPIEQQCSIVTYFTFLIEKLIFETIVDFLEAPLILELVVCLTLSAALI